MENVFQKKYDRILESIEDVAECTQGELILVGGTALALFYLKHRVSVDLDFVPSKTQNDEIIKEKLKGALSKKGYRTQRTAYLNQFVIQFEDCSVKVEIFTPEKDIKKNKEFQIGQQKMKVASIEDLLNMKLEAYAGRLEARDLFDVIFILKKIGRGEKIASDLIKKYGNPKNTEELRSMVTGPDYVYFEEVLNRAA
ncbi:MAG: nucleotidyl transferase AbiEii/AbiGii toxin family protein [Candidatus Micrarchaeota archaeon]